MNSIPDEEREAAAPRNIWGNIPNLLREFSTFSHDECYEILINVLLGEIVNSEIQLIRMSHMTNRRTGNQEEDGICWSIRVLEDNEF